MEVSKEGEWHEASWMTGDRFREAYILTMKGRGSFQIYKEGKSWEDTATLSWRWQWGPMDGGRAIQGVLHETVGWTDLERVKEAAFLDFESFLREIRTCFL